MLRRSECQVIIFFCDAEAKQGTSSIVVFVALVVDIFQYSIFHGI